MLDYLLNYSVILAWIINLYFLAKFASQWAAREPSPVKALLTAAAVALPAVALSFLLPPRGGYDNNHDFLCLGTTFFTRHPLVFPMFKEYSPLFTDGLTDVLSGFSLQAILWKNRLLPALSVFIFIGGMRRLGASLMVSAAGAALLFLNFLSPLSASSFSTTSANMLIWLLSLLALFDAFASPGFSRRSLLWILASALLVISSRFEFLPANLFIFSAILVSKGVRGRKDLAGRGNLLLMASAAFLLAPWAVRALNSHPAHQLRTSFSPAANFFSQLGTANLAVLYGEKPVEVKGDARSKDPDPSPAAVWLSSLFLLTAAAGILIGGLGGGNSAWHYFGPAAPLLLWLFYFSAIFGPPDLYPLHFMRHHLYFFLPLSYLFTLGLAGFESAAARRGRTRAFHLLTGAFLMAYSVLNAKAALGFNGELRTNDREFALLAAAQRDWDPSCTAMYPKTSSADSRADVIRKYFPQLQGAAGPGCALKYVSPEPAIFYGPVPPPLSQQPLTTDADSVPWREASFRHAFYTVLGRQPNPPPGAIRETTEPVPLRLGFFRMQQGRDKAFLSSAQGVNAFCSGNKQTAAVKFREAVQEDPSCLNCLYFLAVSEAEKGRRPEADQLLRRIDQASPAALGPKHRALIRQLLAGDTAGAAGSAREIELKNPCFFLGRNLENALRDPR